MSLARHAAPRATFIVPVYNAQPFLDRSLAEIRRWLSGRPEPWELILVDDASTDASPEIIRRFVDANPGLSIQRVRFDANRGKGFSVRTGLAMARGTYSVFSDCDLAYDLSNVGRILDRLDAGADAAIACRVLPDSRYTMSPSFFSYLFTRHLMGRAFNVVCRVLTVPKLLDTQAGLKGFRTAAVRRLVRRLSLDGFSFDVELLRALIDNGARIVEVPVDFRYDSEPTTVAFAMDSVRMVKDLLLVRARSWLGRYRVEGVEGSAATLVIHADDFGIAPGVNRAIEEALETGAVTSTSLMAGMTHSRAAVDWAAAHPEYDFGVHLNLTLGRPVLPPERVASLVDAAGRFHPLGRFVLRLLLGRIRLPEVVAEWRAQIDFVRAAGVRISHLDSHQHVHLIPALFEGAMAPVAEELGASVRTMNGPTVRAGALPDWKGLALALATVLSLRKRPRARASFRGLGTPFAKRPTVEMLRQMMARMEPGQAYELVVHPGFVDRELIETGDGYLMGRESEQEILASDETRSLLRQNALRLVGFPRASAPVRAAAETQAV